MYRIAFFCLVALSIGWSGFVHAEPAVPFTAQIAISSDSIALQSTRTDASPAQREINRRARTQGLIDATVSRSKADAQGFVHDVMGAPDSQFNSGNLVASPVPEIETWVMLIVGLGAVGLITNRRKHVVIARDRR